MKEHIERAAVKELFERYGATEDALALIENIPAADVVEVMRCQDCKHRIYKYMGFDIGEVGGCQLLDVAIPGDFYCANGARMDKEDEHEAC